MRVNDITCTDHNRSFTRYPSDMSDAEWAVSAPFASPPRPGGPPRTDMREVMNAILYMAGSGIAWRMLPKDIPTVSTVRGYFYAWRNDGTLALMNYAPVQAVRELEGKEPCPNAGIIDSQSVKTMENGRFCGNNASKRIKGRKHHIVTDTNGFRVGLVVHSAAIQDRDGAVPTLQSIRRFYPFLRHIFADGGYSGDKLKETLNGKGDWTFEVIRRSNMQKGFAALPRRWVVKRTFAWLGRYRRLAKDWEASIAYIRILVRRLARHCYI
ncbi:MAG: IS5 family transposase [Rhizobiaceae bacterium]